MFRITVQFNKGRVMRKIKLLGLVFCILTTLVLFGISFADQCSDCPYENPCEYTFFAGDGCNTCLGSTWCKTVEVCFDVDKKICIPEEQWFSTGLARCTLRGCYKEYQIPNPFKEKE